MKTLGNRLWLLSFMYSFWLKSRPRLSLYFKDLEYSRGQVSIIAVIVREIAIERATRKDEGVEREQGGAGGSREGAQREQMDITGLSAEQNG